MRGIRRSVTRSMTALSSCPSSSAHSDARHERSFRPDGRLAVERTGDTYQGAELGATCRSPIQKDLLRMRRATPDLFGVHFRRRYCRPNATPSALPQDTRGIL